MAWNAAALTDLGGTGGDVTGKFVDGVLGIPGDPILCVFTTDESNVSGNFDTTLRFRWTVGGSANFLISQGLLSNQKVRPLGNPDLASQEAVIAGDQAIILCLDGAAAVGPQLTLRRVDGATYVDLATSSTSLGGGDGDVHTIKCEVRSDGPAPTVRVLFDDVEHIATTVVGNGQDAVYGQNILLYAEGSGGGTETLAGNGITDFVLSAGTSANRDDDFVPNSTELVNEQFDGAELDGVKWNHQNLSGIPVYNATLDKFEWPGANVSSTLYAKDFNQTRFRMTVGVAEFIPEVFGALLRLFALNATEDTDSIPDDCYHLDFNSTDQAVTLYRRVATVSSLIKTFEPHSLELADLDFEVIDNTTSVDFVVRYGDHGSETFTDSSPHINRGRGSGVRGVMGNDVSGLEVHISSIVITDAVEVISASGTAQEKHKGKFGMISTGNSGMMS